jgi:predicted ATPase
VWRVVVDGLPATGSVAQAVAEALSVRLQGRQPVADVVEALAERRCLLILDGCEAHVDDVADLVIALLGGCPGVGALVTSREPLHVPGERLRRLAPLRADGPGVPPAVALFVERARAVDPDTVLDDLAVASLVRQLDGLPLALEVAAGFSAGFSPAQMLAGLATGQSLPRSRDRALPERQRSLTELLGWSERLLSPDERAVLRRLSVFVGSFTLSAARAVVSAPPIEPPEVADHLWSLVDRSLVVADSSAGGTRYRMLELVRRFASTRLEQAGEDGPTVATAAGWFAAQVGPSQASGRTWVGRVAADVDTLRYLVEHLMGMSPDDTLIAAELAVTITRYLEGVQAYRPAIEQAERWCRQLGSSPARVALLTQLATLHLRLDEVDQARPWALDAARERDAVGAPAWDEVGVERALGEVANRSGRPADAVALAQNALDNVVSARSRARMFNLLGIARSHLGEVEAAAAAFAQELDACHELGDDLLTTRAEANAAELALRRGLPAKAATHQRACLDLAVALGQPVFVAYSMIVAARVQRAADDVATVRLLSKAIDLLGETHHRLYADDEAEVRRMLAECLGRLGEQAYGRAESAGRALALDEAARLTDMVLRAAAGP